MKNKFLSVIAAVLVAFSLAACSGYSDGERIGTVQKYSYKGVLNKSLEGELAMSGLRHSKNGVSNIFQFTVKDHKIDAKVKEALRSGEEVAIRYDQALIWNPFIQDTGYIVTEVIPNKISTRK